MNHISKRTVKRQGPEDLVNENIRFKELLVIADNGEQLGIMSRNDALNEATSRGLDIVVVSANGNPPVARILDYGKHRYEAQKKAREAKKNQHVTQIKPIRLSPVIDVHDFQTKLRHARKWLETGTKVKVDMRFRGRLITRVEVGRKTMNQFIEDVSDLGTVDSAPKLEGNTMSVIINPLKKI